MSLCKYAYATSLATRSPMAHFRTAVPVPLMLPSHCFTAHLLHCFTGSRTVANKFQLTDSSCRFGTWQRVTASAWHVDLQVPATARPCQCQHCVHVSPCLTPPVQLPQHASAIAVLSIVRCCVHRDTQCRTQGSILTRHGTPHAGEWHGIYIFLPRGSISTRVNVNLRTQSVHRAGTHPLRSVYHTCSMPKSCDRPRLAFTSCVPRLLKMFDAQPVAHGTFIAPEGRSILYPSFQVSIRRHNGVYALGALHARSGRGRVRGAAACHVRTGHDCRALGADAAAEQDQTHGVLAACAIIG